MSENRGLLFFQVFPLGMGIAYGLFQKGFLAFWAWWTEALVFAGLLGLAHVVCRSWLFVAYVRNCRQRGTSPGFLSFVILSSVVAAAEVFAAAGVVLLVKALVA